MILKATSGDRHIEFFPGQSLREVLDSTSYRVRSGCRGTGACGLCRVRVKADETDEPTLAERLYLSPDQIEAGERLACQLRPSRNMEVTILNPAPSSAWKTTSPAYRDCIHADRFPPCPPSNPSMGSKHPYGVAVDLGTTHVSLSFYDLSTGEWLTGRHGLNPQTEYGTDVMTRLTAASESIQAAQTLRKQAIDAIGGAIHDVATREGIGTEQVAKVVLGGNTAMLALLSGRGYHLLLQPAHWTRYIDCLPDSLTDFSMSWGIHPEARIDILPPLAGFVGSDLLAGVLATKLTENGIKYHREEERPKIRVYGKVFDRICTIYIEDNGIGFDEEYLDRIFKPFQRLHGKDEYEGTGMGLAICRKIAERHGGAITAKSTPGQGSVFIVTLPD